MAAGVTFLAGWRHRHPATGVTGMASSGNRRDRWLLVF
ncbi:hypothetical protein LTSEHVI_0840 [Salmonella enterica subsp. enterica serovar Hvittingfoss str. A4-620]|nr:hypothetical protein LTSEHVI_0840 [Salmonella enterica subsp. enterica serovar Hvittingfoss str. A4-620]